MSENYIPLSVPNLKGNELNYVTEAVKTEWVSTSGPYVSNFEEKAAEYVHVKGAVSCQSGTAGLHIALIMSGVTDRDAVIVPTLTFIAAVNPVRYMDAYPIFMDCDDSLCMDPVKLSHYCQQECNFIDGNLIDIKTGRHIKAIIVVHVFGNLADLINISLIAERYNLMLIEDATEAIGTYYSDGPFKGRFAGTIGDIGVYSFNGNKIITTGGGGMIVSNNDKLLKRAKHLTTQAKSDELYYTHDEVGFNYRMTNLQAALGLAQLEQLENFIEIKTNNYEQYNELIQPLNGLHLLSFRNGTRSNHWFYGLYIDQYGMNRDEMIRYLADHQIQTRPIWGLIHEQKPYSDSYSYQIEEAKKYWQHVINLPCSTNLSAADITRVVKCIKSVQ